MKLKSAFLATLFLMALNALSPVWAQTYALEDPADWKEIETPPPPAFDLTKLITFEVSLNSQLVYGVDPATIQISNKDGVVRYVIVASNASGARNVMYEGIRCGTGEFKTYARYSGDKWTSVSKPEWKSMFGNMPSKHALRLAKAGVCDSAAAVQTVDQMVSRLKNPDFRIKD